MLSALVCGLVVVVAACESASNSTGTGPKGRQTSNVTSVTSRPSAVGHETKVSANHAGVAAMTLTFQATGVSDARRWARRVEQQRPYPESDPSFAALRARLAPFHPSAATMERIVSALELP